MAQANITRPELGRIHSSVPHHKQPPIRFTWAVFLNASASTASVREVSASSSGPPRCARCWGECKDKRILRKATGRREAKKERRQGGGGHRRMGRRVGPGCWCELRRRKEEEREKISIYGKKNRRQYKTQKGGCFTVRELLSEVWRRKSGIHPQPDLICGYLFFFPPPFYLCNRRWGRRTRQRREERKDAVSRYSQGCREREEEGRKVEDRAEHVCIAREPSGIGEIKEKKSVRSGDAGDGWELREVFLTARTAAGPGVEASASLAACVGERRRRRRRRG